MDWQDISTAPKDGTWILVCGGQTEDEEKNRTHAVVQWANYLNCGVTDWHWQFAWYDGGYYGRYSNPTHWLPLPETPKGE